MVRIQPLNYGSPWQPLAKWNNEALNHLEANWFSDYHSYTPRKFNTSPLKNGWKTAFLLGRPIFRGCVKLWGGNWKPWLKGRRFAAFKLSPNVSVCWGITPIKGCRHWDDRRKYRDKKKHKDTLWLSSKIRFIFVSLCRERNVDHFPPCFPPPPQKAQIVLWVFTCVHGFTQSPNGYYLLDSSPELWKKTRSNPRCCKFPTASHKKKKNLVTKYLQSW